MGRIKIFLFGCIGLLVFCLPANAQTGKKARVRAKRAAEVKYITAHFPTQFTNPERKIRKNFSQFGYNLSLIPIPLFPITSFINPHNFGIQSYGGPGKGEKNGSLYTCDGGFMDFSHIRVAVDWTVFLTFKMLSEKKGFDLPDEGGHLKLHFTGLDTLSIQDIAAIAERITFERLIWHEVASWQYHPPNYTFDEQQSTFTPEDSYSDLLGAVIGKRVALRILEKEEGLSYAQIATEEIKKMISSLHPLTTIKGSKHAYDIVDRSKQLDLPEGKRNDDVWWDSQIIFADQRYMFKRYINIGPAVAPWLVPESEQLGCSADTKPFTLHLPEWSAWGKSYNSYYEFKIIPDSLLFFNKRTGKQLHEPFGPFITSNFMPVINHIRKQMEKTLLPGFDERDCFDPVPYFKNAVRVMF